MYEYCSQIGERLVPTIVFNGSASPCMIFVLASILRWHALQLIGTIILLRCDNLHSAVRAAAAALTPRLCSDISRRRLPPVETSLRESWIKAWRPMHLTSTFPLYLRKVLATLSRMAAVWRCGCWAISLQAVTSWRRR